MTLPAPPAVSWTPPEEWLLAELARYALVASLDGGPAVRAAHGSRDADGGDGNDGRAPFRVEVHASSGAVTLALELDAERAVLALEPVEVDGNRWRDVWALELVRRDAAGRAESWVLTAGGPRVEVPDARRETLTAHLRVRSRALVRTLEGRDEVVPVSDVTSHRYTQQSSRTPREVPQSLAWMTPTAEEAAPWWEIDIGRVMFVAAIRGELVAPSPGARLAVVAYAYATPAGGPPVGSFRREFAVDTLPRDADGRVRFVVEVVEVVARLVRVTLAAPAGHVATLEVAGLEVLAAAPYADTLRATMRRAFALHRDRTLTAARAADDAPYLPELSYGDVWSRAMALARGLARRLESVSAGEGARVFLAIVVRNRVEWLMADLAAIERGYVVVPIAPDDPDERLAQILARMRPACVVCEAGDAERLARLAPVDSPPRLVVACDATAADARAWNPDARVRFEDVVREGTGTSAPAPAPRRDDELHSVLFTSGSTGTPKGATRSYGTFHALLASYGVDQDARHLSFQPLSHLSERMYLPALVVHGGLVAFSRGGAHLMSELRAFEPTAVSSVPRLFEVLLAGYQRALRAALAAEPAVPRATHERAALATARRAFGDRVRVVSVGSAPVSPEVLAFLRRCFADLWVADGYGSTEVGTIAVNGTIAQHVEVKLVAPADAANTPGAPERGEIWVRTPHVIEGYFGDPEATAAALDRDGYFATGDLGERGADGTVRVVGRVRNTVKLGNGEFVSAERVESALATAALVDRVFVHAQPGAAGVAALVVPQREALARLLADPDAPLRALTARDDAAPRVLAALQGYGRRNGLAAWEVPRGVVLEADPPSVANGLLTPSGKLARGALTERYGAGLAAVAAGPGGLADADPEAAVPEGDDATARIVRIAARVLGRAVDPHAPLGEGAGVDSLAAADVLAAIGEDLGRTVPLSLWFESASLDDLAARLTRFAAGATSPAIARLVAEDRARAPAASHAAAPPHAPPRTVLLTGATGLLGAHLLETLVTRTALRVTCLVRARSDDDAARRVRASLATYAIPIALDARVAFVAGDLAAPRLGVSSARFDAMAAELDAVLHAGATVSWLASYAALRGANVHGTATLIELASAVRRKPLHFVSTISTAPADGDERSRLALDALQAASPYALTKGIAEDLVRRAGDAGLPVAVYRPGLISGHSARGHGNPDDYVHRYLVGAAELGVYLDLADARLDMTPVDFVAAAIVALFTAQPLGGDTHHLVNVAQSLTYAEIGRALATAGLGVAPVAYAAFRAALLRARTSRLHALAGYFPEDAFGLGSGPWPCTRTLAALATLGVVPPRIDDAYIARHVASLARRGLLPAT